MVKTKEEEEYNNATPTTTTTTTTTTTVIVAISKFKLQAEKLGLTVFENNYRRSEEGKLLLWLCCHGSGSQHQEDVSQSPLQR
jgi:hypothetical protein